MTGYMIGVWCPVVTVHQNKKLYVPSQLVVMERYN
jgi:hypothetical protein